MRQVIQLQKKLGQTDISKIEIDLRCRDEIPKILLGLQKIYCNREISEKVFEILRNLFRQQSMSIMVDQVWISGKFLY